MQKCLSTERSSINVEAEPRTYCCGGRVAALEGAIDKKNFGCWCGKKKFERWQGKIFWGMGWPNIFRGGMVERFLEWSTKNFGGSMAKYFGDGVTKFLSGKKFWGCKKFLGVPWQNILGCSGKQNLRIGFPINLKASIILNEHPPPHE